MEFVQWKRGLAGLLCAAVLFGGCGRAAEPAESSVDVVVQSALTAAQKQSAKALDTAGKDKTETVYAKADPTGAVYKTEVEVLLKSAADGAEIADISCLSDIKNMEGNEEFAQNGNALVWQNHGEDIRYKGTAAQPLPVTVAIRYWLNGAPIAPEQLVGQSGHVTIRFDYQNNTQQTVTVEGQQYTVITPFAVLSAVVLPENTFANVTVENGDVLEFGGETIAVGMALPGVEKALQLEDSFAEELHLPEYVEISADVVDFSLAFTATVISNGLFSDIEDSDFEPLQALSEDAQALGEASGELQKGLGQLEQGAGTLQAAFGEYLTGVKAFAEGVDALSSGLTELDGQAGQLATGAAALTNGMSALEQQLNALLAQLSTQAEALEAAGVPVEALEQNIAALRQAAKSVGENSAALSEGTALVSAYLHSAAQACGEASQQAGQLVSYGDSLASGLSSLEQGLVALSDGFDAFDREDIQALCQSAGEDVQQLEGRIKALRAADQAYTNFSGLPDGKTGSVRFLVESDALE